MIETADGHQKFEAFALHARYSHRAFSWDSGKTKMRTSG
jgi:hypothetical protein